MSLTAAPDDELRDRRQISADVLEALVLAGLPAHLATPDQPDVPGAEIEGDQLDDEAGGVFIHWTASQDLRDRLAAPLLAQEFDHPAIRLNGSINQAMTRAMQAILEASGFTTEDPDDEYRPLSLRVSGTK